MTRCCYSCSFTVPWNPGSPMSARVAVCLGLRVDVGHSGCVGLGDESRQCLHHVRVLSGEVSRLSRVLAQVEQQRCCRPTLLHQLPVPLTHREFAWLAAVSLNVVDDRRARRGAPRRHRIPDIDTVKAKLCNAAAGEATKRRKPVGNMHETVVVAIECEIPTGSVTSGHQPNTTNTALPKRRLAAFQREIGRFAVEGATVVCGEDQDGVVPETRLFEGVGDVAHTLVHGRDHGAEVATLLVRDKGVLGEEARRNLVETTAPRPRCVADVNGLVWKI
mmetsp:Transcript_29791/g.70030  ORF Transcript_29791/g.70030 Transcript_29791/m.70030 type:complete len:276 (-) Transcript_29791:593-1420(-)